MLKEIFYISKTVRSLLILTLILATVRIFVFKTTTSNYIYWNLFLALIPLFISSLIFYFNSKNKINKVALVLGIIIWLLFLPNALYIVTDLIHVGRIRAVPTMFDAVLVFSAALSGVIIGIISIFRMEDVLKKFYSSKIVSYIILFSILFASFGVYIGRFLRFNSWDIVTNAILLWTNIKEIFINPIVNSEAFLYTILFFALFYILYITFKRLELK